MRLNDAGRIVWEVWNSLPARYPQVALGTAVVMPNHFHGIVGINEILASAGTPVWQRNYYEHIIQDNDEHNRIRLYIESNPLNWTNDDENPERRR